MGPAAPRRGAIRARCLSKCNFRSDGRIIIVEMQALWGRALAEARWWPSEVLEVVPNNA